ncbi:MAG: carbohydrate kinase family protein [Oscillospiraceae bacterium]|nr:carbohydrate kinase family protein [Oscillospiraceae bacterium]
MDIVGIGRPCIDILTVVDKLPKPDSGAGILDFSRQGGGNVATAMVAAARLGAKVGMIGVTGTCIHGKAIREDFAYNNVDISQIVTVDGAPNDFAIILSDLETKGRSILYKGGGLRQIDAGDLNKDYITSANILHLEGGPGDVEITAALWMKEAGKKVAYDVANYSERIKYFTPLIDIFIASEFYYKAAFGADENYEKNCKLVSETGPEIVVFTLGKKGCVGYSKSEGFFVEEAFKVNVFDTLGAGDVYHGAFLAGLTKGFSVRETAKFANAVSAIKICYIGGRAGIPSFEVAEKFIRTGEIDDTELRQRVDYYRNKWIYSV